MDLYPVTLTVGAQSYPKARVFVQDGQARAFVDGSPPRLVAAGSVDAGLTRVHGNARQLTVDGEPWHVVRAGGCGCGSRLRRLTAAEAFAVEPG